MAAIQPQALDRTTEEKPAEPDNLKEQHHSVINETSISSNSSSDNATIGHMRDTADQHGSLGSNGDHPVHPSNIYAPQAQPMYYKGFDNANVEWDEYAPYVNPEGLDVASPGVYNENPSLIFHSGYGYNAQLPYGPYSPVTPPLPSVGEGQLYSHQQFSFSGPPYYQQLVPPSMSYLTSPTPVSQPESTNLINIDQQGDGVLYGPRPGYPPVGPFGRGIFPGTSGTFGFHDSQQGFSGSQSGGIWSDSKPLERQQCLVPPLSPAVSPQPIGPLGSFRQNVGMVPQQQRPLYGFGSGSNSYNRRGMPNHGPGFGGTTVSSMRSNEQRWLSFGNSRWRSRTGGSLGSYNGTFDILVEQNRGPRSSRMKNQISSEDISSIDKNKHNRHIAKIHNKSFNQPDFVIEYADAKFFIIKSYSEDNVHKSIKYGVWASTPNGNRKLDAAYRQAKEKLDSCPIFLLFSVNASGQFCGVAEMVGPVDFEKSVTYWQQDKWSGQFLVRWHIIKDVPNGQFRHIILENNDNKPVTNSRDTQEVNLEQGIEMLKIFKNYETDMSILDDFDFYEEREKGMQEQKAARQQANQMAVGVGENEHRNSATLSVNIIKPISKSFAQVVLSDEGGDAVTAAQGSASAPDGSTGITAKLEDDTTVTVSSTKNS